MRLAHRAGRLNAPAAGAVKAGLAPMPPKLKTCAKDIVGNIVGGTPFGNPVREPRQRP